MELLVGSLKGRSAAKLEAEVLRELTEDEVLIRSLTPIGSETAPIAKLRFNHHRLAQLLASGLAPADASLLTGYSSSRISILQNDPAFRELMAHYGANQREVYADLHQKMAGIAMVASEELQDRLEENPSSIATKDLLTTIKLTNDRAGNAPIAKSEHRHIVLTAEDIENIRKEVKLKENAITHHNGPEVSQANLPPPAETGDAQETKGLPSQGEDL